MVEKVILFYNPAAGHGKVRNNLDRIIERYQYAGYIVVPVRSSEPNGLDTFFKKMDKETYREEYKHMAVAGGDGTVHIAVNTMMNNGINLPIAVLPLGTANDYGYTMGIPEDIDGMMDAALSGNYTKADLAKINDKYFINVAAMGQIVDVSQKTPPERKEKLGALAYYLEGASEAMTLRPMQIRITTDKKVYNEEIYCMIVMNGGSAGGFRKVSPISSVNDGLLDVIAFKKMPYKEMLPVLFMIIAGKHHKSRNVLYVQSEYVKIESEEEFITDVDGEEGENLPLEIRALHEELTICTLQENMGLGLPAVPEKKKGLLTKLFGRKK